MSTECDAVSIGTGQSGPALAARLRGAVTCSVARVLKGGKPPLGGSKTRIPVDLTRQSSASGKCWGETLAQRSEPHLRLKIGVIG